MGGIKKIACIFAIAAGILAAAWVVYDFADLFLHEQEDAAEAIMAAKDVASSSQEGSPAAGSSEANRQAVISMGQNPGTVYVSWTGNAKEPEYLRYSDDPYSLPVAAQQRAERKKLLSDGWYRYTVTLRNLAQGKLYYYEIGDGTSFDSPRFFYAPKEGGEDVFAYLGDPQFDNSVADYHAWGDLVWNMYKNNADLEFAIAGGDLVNVPTDEAHWKGFLDNCGLFSMIPLMTIPGNHEGVSSNNTYKKIFHHVGNGPAGEAFYYFDYGHCRFIMLDSSFLTGDRKKRMGEAAWKRREAAVERWLRQTLAQSDKTWNIVAVHHPVYGMHDVFTVSPQIRESWLPIMEAGGVDLVLCGHQHVYMRTRKIDGIVHVMGVSGAKRSNYYKGFNAPNYSESLYAAGANYQIIRATADRLELTSYSKNGHIIDAAHIEKGLAFRAKKKLGIPVEE